MLVEAVSDDYQPLEHVKRAYKNSECRTPVFLVLRDGDPYQSVVRLAKDVGSTVWRVEMGNSKNEQNALDYVDVGIQNGDWVYVTKSETASPEVLRSIAVALYSLKPEPKRFPRREHFRVFFTVEEPFNLNDNISMPFPRLLAQYGILARRRKEDGGSPTKWTKKLPEESDLLVKEVVKHQTRKERGRDSDSESDAEEPQDKLTGLWFHRAVDFYSSEGSATLKKPQDEIFEVTDVEHTDRIRELCSAGLVDLSKVKRDGMTPLQYAVSRERIASVRTLLECGADPNAPRESDGCPPLFMCLESEDIVLALVEAGADVYAKFEGDRVEHHSSTAPHIAALVKKIRLANEAPVAESSASPAEEK